VGRSARPAMLGMARTRPAAWPRRRRALPAPRRAYGVQAGSPSNKNQPVAKVWGDVEVPPPTHAINRYGSPREDIAPVRPLPRQRGHAIPHRLYANPRWRRGHQRRSLSVPSVNADAVGPDGATVLRWHRRRQARLRTSEQRGVDASRLPIAATLAHLDQRMTTTSLPVTRPAALNACASAIRWSGKLPSMCMSNAPSS
jgi:hypothetical protein